MEKLKELLKNKKVLLIGGAVLVVLIAIIAIVMTTNGNENKINLEENLSKAGTKFYKEYYYPQIKDKNDLKMHKDNGLNLTVKNLEVLVELDEETKKAFDEKKCDYDKTKLIIYPKNPYGENDYKVEVQLACDNN